MSKSGGEKPESIWHEISKQGGPVAVVTIGLNALADILVAKGVATEKEIVQAQLVSINE